MKICIYGAALDEIPENYRKGAEDFGRALAKRGHSLLFGGGKHGCMGAVARGVAAEGGEVSAITPDFLNQGDDLFQPCHRVVGSTGKLTGYAYGVEMKQYLLELEQQE